MWKFEVGLRNIGGNRNKMRRSITAKIVFLFVRDEHVACMVQCIVGYERFEVVPPNGTFMY